VSILSLSELLLRRLIHYISFVWQTTGCIPQNKDYSLIHSYLGLHNILYIKMTPRDHLAQDRDEWLAFVNMVMNLGFHTMLGNSWVAGRLLASLEWFSSEELIGWSHQETESEAEIQCHIIPCWKVFQHVITKAGKLILGLCKSDRCCNFSISSVFHIRNICVTFP
jgi:hypothetical protein